LLDEQVIIVLIVIHIRNVVLSIIEHDNIVVVFLLV
jgi:hypothetical protein